MVTLARLNSASEDDQISLPMTPLSDWISDYSVKVLIREFLVGDGKCNLQVSNIDTGDFIVVTGVYQPGFLPMYAPPKNTMPTIYFCCCSVDGEVLASDNPIRRLMRQMAHQALDEIYKRK